MLFHLPALQIYESYGFYKNGSLLSQLSLGNMGFSETHCLIDTFAEGAHKNTGSYSQAAVDASGFKLKCNSGEITELLDFGITVLDEKQQMCQRGYNRQLCNKYLNN